MPKTAIKKKPAKKSARFYMPKRNQRDEDGLTPQESRFVDALVANPGDKWQALKLAGYKGYTPAVASIGVKRLLARAPILKALARRRSEIAVKTDVNAARIIQELATIAFLDPGELFDDKEQLIPLKEMPERVRRAIMALEVQITELGGKKDKLSRDIIKKFKLSPKLAALELLMRNMGMLNDKLNLGLLSGQMPIAAMREAIELADAEDAQVIEDGQKRIGPPATQDPPNDVPPARAADAGDGDTGSAAPLEDGGRIDLRSLDIMRGEE
jgi:phage terminase small subunit